MISWTRFTLALVACAVALVLLASLSMAQDSNAVPNKQPAQKQEQPASDTASEEALVIIPTSPDEIAVESSEKHDVKDLVIKSLGRMGGADALEKLKDLAFTYNHKNYYQGDQLYFEEDAEGFMIPGRFYKARLDFKSYVKTSNLKGFHDYREVIGDDGEFKYIDGRMLTSPDALRAAGDRITQFYMNLFGPWDLARVVDQMEYQGQVTWTETIDNEKVVRKCHKILVPYDRDRLLVRQGHLAIYIDTDSYDFRRYVCEPKAPFVHRVRVVDFREHTDVMGLKLPTWIFSTDYWDGKLNCTHQIWFNDYVANSGLEGIGFEMTNQ